jgi:hypothetical protein
VTAEIIQMKEPRSSRVRKAYEAWRIADDRWVETTLALAIEMAAAREECGGNDRAFGVYLAENDCAMSRNDSSAFVGLGQHPEISRRVLAETTSRSVRLIWEEVKPLICPSVGTDAAEPPLIPEPEVLAAVTGQTGETRFWEPEVSAPSTEPTLYPVPKKSRLQEKIGDKPAGVLLSRFEHARMFATLLSGDGKLSKEKSTLRYLAERCIKPDYPAELFLSQKWDTRLLYPHLPQKLLNMLPKKLGTLYDHHVVLVETEEQFRRTPEFGVTNPPLVAFNKAYAIYQALDNAKKGITVDKSAIYSPTYTDDEGKPPVIICGTQLWPAETGEGYRYDDLRCACGLAEDVLTTFGQARDVPMTTKSLKLRHLMAWLPGGYNSVGSTLEGTIKALRSVVQAYGANKSEVMRSPLPSLKKLDEV